VWRPLSWGRIEVKAKLARGQLNRVLGLEPRRRTLRVRAGVAQTKNSFELAQIVRAERTPARRRPTAAAVAVVAMAVRPRFLPARRGLSPGSKGAKHIKHTRHAAGDTDEDPSG
jgi:hypothetical protein